MEITEAADAGDLHLIKQLLGQLLPTERDSWLRDSLLRATYENRPKAVETLLKAGTPIESADDLGNTAMHWACRRVLEDIARVLLDKKASLGARNKEGLTPLHIAVQQNNGPMVQLFIGNKADVLATADDGRTPLHMAADSGAAVAAAVILTKTRPPETEGEVKQPNPTLELVTDRGETPMLRAAARGQPAIIQLLLRAGAKPTHTNFWGQSALQLAAHGGHVGAVSVLLEASVDVNAAAEDGTTAVHRAVQAGHAQVTELLMTHHANADAKAAGGRAALHCAAEALLRPPPAGVSAAPGSDAAAIACAQVLINHGATVDATTREDRTPLSFAAARGNVGVTRKLLEAGCEVTALDAVRQTALHAAALQGRADVIDVLVAFRIPMEIKDAAGRTAMDIAIAARQHPAIRALMKQGAILPESAYAVPELMPLIREVEEEILQAQLKEAAAGTAEAALANAEKEFDHARFNLIKQCGVATAAKCSPAINHFEVLLANATQEYKTSIHETARLKKLLASTEDALAAAMKELATRQAKLKAAQKALADAKAEHERQSIEINGLRRELQETRKQTKATEEKTVALLQPIADTEAHIAEVTIRNSTIADDNSALEKELKKVRAELAKWHKEKEQALQLHLKAHGLLNRKGSRPSSAGEAGA